MAEITRADTWSGVIFVTILCTFSNVFKCGDNPLLAYSTIIRTMNSIYSLIMFLSVQSLDASASHIDPDIIFWVTNHVSCVNPKSVFSFHFFYYLSSHFTFQVVSFHRPQFFIITFLALTYFLKGLIYLHTSSKSCRFFATNQYVQFIWQSSYEPQKHSLSYPFHMAYHLHKP